MTATQCEVPNLFSFLHKILEDFSLSLNWVQRNATAHYSDNTVILYFFFTLWFICCSISNFLATQFANCSYYFSFTLRFVLLFIFVFGLICTKTYRLAILIAWNLYSCNDCSFNLSLDVMCSGWMRKFIFEFLGTQYKKKAPSMSKNITHLCECRHQCDCSE